MVHRPPVRPRQRSDRAGSPSPGRRRPGSARFASSRRGRTAAALLALTLAASAHYTVQPGDTLSGIAAQHGTSVRAIADANGIADVNRIAVGSSLAIPGASGGGGSTASGGTAHVVKPGETLSGIAVRYGVRSAAIAAANGITDRNVIVAGRRLTIPAGTTATTASSGETRVQAAGAPAASASRADVGALIEQTARAHGWNPAFVKAVAWQESGWNNGVVSPGGALGIMQVMPATGTWISTYLNGGRALDLNDPADNVLGGILFLDYLHGITDGDVDMILAGYYQGLASVDRNGVFPSTKQYIANVKALRERF